MTITYYVDRETRRHEQLVAEKQRIDHLVLGLCRPEPETLPPKPKGMPKAEWKIRKASLRAGGAILAPGIEERVALRERWSHKQGTPETLEHVDQTRRRPGSLARLYESGAIDKDQLAAADQIAEAYRTITSDVSVRTASFETRLDGSAHGRVEQLQLGRVHADLSYTWWRAALGACAEPLLEVIVHDVGLTIVARHICMSMPRARRMLTDALNLWSTARRRTRDHAIAIAA